MCLEISEIPMFHVNRHLGRQKRALPEGNPVGQAYPLYTGEPF